MRTRGVSYAPGFFFFLYRGLMQIIAAVKRRRQRAIKAARAAVHSENNTSSIVVVFTNVTRWRYFQTRVLNADQTINVASTQIAKLLQFYFATIK